MVFQSGRHISRKKTNLHRGGSENKEIEIFFNLINYDNKQQLVRELNESELWSLETHKEIGKTKFPCATRIQWSPCGRYYLCSVLYERLKVDNCF